MSTPRLEVNVVATHVYPVSDLGLPTTVGAGSSYDGTVFTTGIPATVIVVASLTSGTATVKVDRAASAAAVSYGSPDTSMALSSTTKFAATLDTTSGETYVGVQLSNTSGGAVVNLFAVFVMYELTPGEDWFDGVRSSHNAVSNTSVGDGSGAVTLTPTTPTSTVVL